MNAVKVWFARRWRSVKTNPVVLTSAVAAVAILFGVTPENAEALGVRSGELVSAIDWFIGIAATFYARSRVIPVSKLNGAGRIPVDVTEV